MGSRCHRLSMEFTDANFTEPRVEAAFFYGLFLRGHPVQKLRADIDVPPRVLAEWRRLAIMDPLYVGLADRILAYRKHVLAIFDSLILKGMQAPTMTQ
jgi:hypothetical protein